MSLVRSKDTSDLRSVADVSGFGFVRYLTAALPDRVYAGLDDAERPPSVKHDEADVDVEHLPTPLECLLNPPSEYAWPTETRRTVGRLQALWLIAEDRYRLLDADRIDTLAHQASLVEHIVSSPELTRVLVADEVGLGKTVEAGLLIRRLQEAASASLRVLYLTEARLVRNVVEEFERLGLHPREWSTARQEARLVPGDSDPLVVASMHKAVVNRETVAAAGPWDVLFVDEAHHLTDWSPDGSDPQQRMRLCRDIIRDRLAPNGRVYLLTGTPHQGSEERFNNLLRLLSADGDRSAARGKVIYRIKDDIVGWDGQPLFPKRQVNPPTEIDAGPEYSDWLSRVHRLLTPPAGNRAAGWRRAQALQWCASSPQAGVAYLARLAIRSGFDPKALPVLRDALLALRPYRGGSPSEPLEFVQQRLMQGRTPLEEDVDEVIDESELPRVLSIGVDLIQSDVIERKLEKVVDWLGAEESGKLVVFAQPVETVYIIKDRLESKLGSSAVSLIVGAQTPMERLQEIEAFWDRDERRVLVSSRAGGEGINLQVARRLVHFDVPWNPMEMEQRVGRIHRYGSVDTVVVDTLVLKDSREQRVLNRSRARLGRIVRDLDRDRFELLFSRTMALIPLEEIAGLMAGENFGELTPADEERIDRLITAGYESWKARDAEFRRRTEHLRTVERGPVTDEDLLAFLTGPAGGALQNGWTVRHLEEDRSTGRTVSSEQPATIICLPDGTVGYVGERKGVSFAGPTSAKPRRLGLNDRSVAARLRQLVGGALSDGKSDRAIVPGAGAALVHKSDWMRFIEENVLSETYADGAVLLAYLVRYLEADARIREVGVEFRCHLQTADGAQHQRLDAPVSASLIRLLRTPRAKRSRPTGLTSEVLQAEAVRIAGMQTRQKGEPLRAVFPIGALWIEPTDAPASGESPRE